jgi:hypothetical protein
LDPPAIVDAAGAVPDRTAGPNHLDVCFVTNLAVGNHKSQFEMLRVTAMMFLAIDQSQSIHHLANVTKP